jgi:hypothetical protein
MHDRHCPGATAEAAGTGSRGGGRRSPILAMPPAAPIFAAGQDPRTFTPGKAMLAIIAGNAGRGLHRRLQRWPRLPPCSACSADIATFGGRPWPRLNEMADKPSCRDIAVPQSAIPAVDQATHAVDFIGLDDDIFFWRVVYETSLFWWHGYAIDHIAGRLTSAWHRITPPPATRPAVPGVRSGPSC